MESSEVSHVCASCGPGVPDALSLLQVAEAALADEWVKHGDRIALQRRALRLGKPPRRWKRPSWAESAMWEPAETCITGINVMPAPVHGVSLLQSLLQHHQLFQMRLYGA